jgi:hypothetical protein
LGNRIQNREGEKEKKEQKKEIPALASSIRGIRKIMALINRRENQNVEDKRRVENIGVEESNRGACFFQRHAAGEDVMPPFVFNRLMEQS